MNITDCKPQYSNNIMHFKFRYLQHVIFNLHVARILPWGLWNYIYIWNFGAMTTCTSDANANIPHINIKMLTMSSVHWWLILHVPETVLVDNDLHYLKPIPTHCNSFAGNVSRMWLNIHSAWAQDLRQQSTEIKAKNACCKYSGSQHRLQHSFSKCTATTASEQRPLLGMFEVTVKGCRRNTATESTNSTNFIRYHAKYYCNKV